MRPWRSEAPAESSSTTGLDLSEICSAMKTRRDGSAVLCAFGHFVQNMDSKVRERYSQTWR